MFFKWDDGELDGKEDDCDANIKSDDGNFLDNITARIEMRIPDTHTLM